MQEELDRLGRTVAETAARAGRIGPVTGVASSADSMVTVTVSPGGMLRSVDIKPAVLARHPDEVAAEVVRLAARATTAANSRMHSSLRSVLPPKATESLADLGMPAGHGPDDPDDLSGVFQ
ncbi:YbaB/EbfC DNA-binding family protein [Actinocrispum wychmicini]|uniref:YbaB/EbfC DNA-binding family protein n=1 Tax=Actinocrispum wychmicini TaxID=1213861 RepID=A0A4R2K1G7_9PSEU|nr:YbaB/EbfC DNA-binding family protein [Actinocrispum wychmicini]